MSPTWSSVIARRVERNHLAAPGSDPAQVVAAMCGAHAQVMSAAEISVAMRLAEATRTDVQKALWTDRTLVKTFGPRGTVHLLPTRDLGLWAGALAALPHLSPFAADVRMTPDQNDRVVAALDSALRAAPDGLTVDELSAEVVERAGPWAGDLVMPAFQTMWPRWRTIVGSPLTQGVLCFGPQRGRKVTYASPATWASGFSVGEPLAALREVIRRYLWSYGPATSAQVARWLAAPPRFVAEVFASLDLQPVTIEGEPAMLLAGDDSFPSGAAPGVRLLPYFDAYGVGAHPRAVTFPGRAFERALARGQAGNYPVLLIDGRAAGVWHQRLSGRRVQVTVEPLDPLPAARLRALEAEVERLGQILGATPTLTIGAVTVGAHA
ncbi:winged helix DNA-binding domain-containing protein [Actinoplanes sp. TRM 88003]|uniref:Winged helix DNA-binding domain-containing protein n=1 Tax=Paractinoplanes aksuensis TaxID=2939490 RepID=A0ABT1DKJ9_9ACTN|nr:winged helix DNA-binding domain-containing protein [Actinoplanes aksuensis]MCO8270296.1 winged helix DNA-binding domain-containing protein [Actinoplanes aksuensis]